MSEPFVNISGYRFVAIPDRVEMRYPLRDFCVELGLKGTILLSGEGINFFLAGSEEATDQFLARLDEDERFRDIPLKVSRSDEQPFNRMLVRLKREIISIGLDEVKPAEFTGPNISPREFKEWLDEGREVAILDTRNDYELRMGKFEGAIDLDLGSFRDFPKAIESLPESMKEKPVVMYCTGGIRCEKASAVMLNAGFTDVRQLKGGILGYFEECGGDHWDGECFVFDRRVGVDSELNETGTVVCFECREPLTEEDQASVHYRIAESCPYCIRLPAQ
jgi:predicted sulfurtransferase